MADNEKEPIAAKDDGLFISSSRGDCQSVEPRERLIDPYVAAVIEASGAYLDTVAELARECA